MCKEVCILLSHLMSSPHIARVSVVGLRAGTASFSMATATKTLGENLCMRQDALALHCSNYLAWIDNQVGREAGKKASLLMREKSNLNFSVSIKPAVCQQNVDLSHQQREGEVSRLDQICISIVTGIENSIIYSTRDYFSTQKRHLEVV